MYLLSCIISCYNENDNLKVLFQQIHSLNISNNVEFIIINNGSIDNTKKTLNKLKKKYKFIKIFHLKEDKGWGNGNFFGLKKAKGKYLGWIHGDLQYDLKIIKKIINKLKINKNKKIFFKGLRIKRDSYSRIFTYLMSLICSIILRKFLWDINAQPSIFHKSFLSNWKNPPKNTQLDLYSYYKAKLKNFKIERLEIEQKDRIYGKSSWNFGFFSKIRFGKETIRDCILINKKVYF